MNNYHHENIISPMRNNSLSTYTPPTGIRPPITQNNGIGMINSNYVSPPYGMLASQYNNYDASFTQVAANHSNRMNPYHLRSTTPPPPPFGTYSSDPFIQQQQQQLALQQYNIQQQMIALQQFSPPPPPFQSSSNQPPQSSIQSSTTMSTTTQQQQQQQSQQQHSQNLQQQSNRIPLLPPSSLQDQMSVSSEETYTSISSVLKTLSPAIPTQAEIIEQLKNHHKNNKKNKLNITTTTTTTTTNNSNVIRSNQYPYNINSKSATNETSNPSIITKTASNNNFTSSLPYKNNNNNQNVKEQQDKYNNNNNNNSSNTATKNKQGFSINNSYSNDTRTAIDNNNSSNNNNNNNKQNTTTTTTTTNFDPEIYTKTLITGQITNANNKYYQSTNIPQINSKYIDTSDEDNDDDDSDSDSDSDLKDDKDAYNSQGFSATNSINSTITEDTTILKNKYASSFITTKTMTGPITAISTTNNDNKNNNYTDNVSSAINELQNNNNNNSNSVQIPPARKAQSTQERAQLAKLKSSASFLLERSVSPRTPSPVIGLNPTSTMITSSVQQQQQSNLTTTNTINRAPSPISNGIGSMVPNKTSSSNLATLGTKNRAPSPVGGLKPPISAAVSNRPISPVGGLRTNSTTITTGASAVIANSKTNQILQKKLSGNSDLFDSQGISKSASGTTTGTAHTTKIQSTSTSTLQASSTGVIQAQPKSFTMRVPSPSSSLVVGATTGAKTFKMIPPISVKSKMVVPSTSTSAIRKNNYNLTHLTNKASSSASITSSLFSDSDSTIDPEKIARRKAAVESLKSLLNSTED